MALILGIEILLPDYLRPKLNMLSLKCNPWRLSGTLQQELRDLACLGWLKAAEMRGLGSIFAYLGQMAVFGRSVPLFDVTFLAEMGVLMLKIALALLLATVLFGLQSHFDARTVNFSDSVAVQWNSKPNGGG